MCIGLAFHSGMLPYVCRVQKKVIHLLFQICLTVLDKFNETFSKYAWVNMSTDGNLILTELVKCSLCSDIRHIRFAESEPGFELDSV